jgi:hypothetical protein
MVAALAYQQMRDAIGPKPRGFTAIGVFLFFGAVMASLAATTLLWRGTALDRLWTLNPTAYKQLAPLGRIVGISSWRSARPSSRQESDGFNAAFGDGD